MSIRDELSSMNESMNKHNKEMGHKDVAKKKKVAAKMQQKQKFHVSEDLKGEFDRKADPSFTRRHR